jgi:hypothetical protein
MSNERMPNQIVTARMEGIRKRSKTMEEID